MHNGDGPYFNNQEKQFAGKKVDHECLLVYMCTIYLFVYMYNKICKFMNTTKIKYLCIYLWYKVQTYDTLYLIFSGAYTLGAVFDILVHLEPSALDSFTKLKLFYTTIIATSAFDGIRDFGMYFKR